MPVVYIKEEPKAPGCITIPIVLMLFITSGIKSCYDVNNKEPIDKEENAQNYIQEYVKNRKYYNGSYVIPGIRYNSNIKEPTNKEQSVKNYSQDYQQDGNYSDDSYIIPKSRSLHEFNRDNSQQEEQNDPQTLELKQNDYDYQEDAEPYEPSPEAYY